MFFVLDFILENVFNNITLGNLAELVILLAFFIFSMICTQILIDDLGKDTHKTFFQKRE
jgi:hypothetical protein